MHSFNGKDEVNIKGNLVFVSSPVGSTMNAFGRIYLRFESNEIISTPHQTLLILSGSMSYVIF
jgi:hypothetical protein